MNELLLTELGLPFLYRRLLVMKLKGGGRWIGEPWSLGRVPNSLEGGVEAMPAPGIGSRGWWASEEFGLGVKLHSDSCPLMCCCCCWAL